MDKKNIRVLGIAVFMACAACVAQAAEEDGEWGISVGYDYTSGKYGAIHDTTGLNIPVSLDYSKGDYSFSLTVPYVKQNGPTGRVLRVPLRPEIASVSGIGDIGVSVTRYFSGEDEDSAGFSLAALANFGTADANKGLGTGKNDYSIQGDVSKPFGASTLAATLGYTVTGKPEGLGLRNVFYGALDAAFKISDKAKTGLTLNFGMATLPGTANPRDLTVYFNYNLGEKTRLQAYLLKGFSDGSPDYGNGASLAFDF